MRDLFRLRNLALFGLVALFPLLVPAAAQGCEICRASVLNPARSWCRPVSEGETGVTNCVDHVSHLGDSYCTEEGTFCSWVNAGGGSGGSGGGSGGGGSSCTGSGFCPAECFSCGGPPKN
jgi:hypothetical protein